MIRRLQQKWNVSGTRLLLILVTFATGGSLTGYVGKRIMELTGIENPLAWYPVYIVLITFIWPVMVILVSIPLGQYGFFKAYIGNLTKKITNSKARGDKHA